MKHEIDLCRRKFIRFGSVTLAAMPLVVVSNIAASTTNPGARSALKYQNQPVAGKSCSGCTQFDSGTMLTTLGSCKLMPGDNEISPNGYCAAWGAKAN